MKDMNGVFILQAQNTTNWQLIYVLLTFDTMTMILVFTLLCALSVIIGGSTTAEVTPPAVKGKEDSKQPRATSLFLRSRPQDQYGLVELVPGQAGHELTLSPSFVATLSPSVNLLLPPLFEPIPLPKPPPSYLHPPTTVPMTKSMTMPPMSMTMPPMTVLQPDPTLSGTIVIPTASPSVTPTVSPSVISTVVSSNAPTLGSSPEQGTTTTKPTVPQLPLQEPVQGGPSGGPGSAPPALRGSTLPPKRE